MLTRSFRLAGAVAVTVVLVSTFVAPASAGDPTFVVAVVRDGPPPGEDMMLAVETELIRHLQAGVTVGFKADSSFDAGWDPAQVPGAVEAALADPEVDFILVTGALGTAHALTLDLAKPVISAFVQRADVFHLPFTDEDNSLHDNLVFIVQPQLAKRGVEAFRRLVPFETLHILVGAENLAYFPSLESQLRTVGAELGVAVKIVPVSDDVESMLTSLGADEVEAAYLSVLPQLDTAARRRLILGLTDRGIPTFSLIGHPDVERGALAGITPDMLVQVVRRTALNLSRLVRGEPASDLPVLLTADSRLLVNGRTAAALEISPSQEVRMFAAFLHGEAMEDNAEPLVLAEALRLAGQQNAALSVQDAVTESAQHQASIFGSSLWPQINADLAYLETDAALAFTSAGLATDGSTRALLSLDQLIYDDRVMSGYKQSKHLAESSVENREAVRLDVLAEAGTSYLNLALAHELYEVDLSNLRLSEDNLELARLREQVGYSGRDEVLRWQAAVAENRSALFARARDSETARITLNQVLGVDQDRRWRPEEAAVNPEVFSFLQGRLTPFLGQPGAQRRLREVFTEVALGNSPEIRALDQIAEAQGVEVSRSKRAYWLPSFFARATYADDIGGGTGDFPGLEGDNYTVSVALSYPLFQGGRRTDESAKARSDMEAVERQLTLTHQLVERRMRTATRQVESSFPSIKFSLMSAEASGDNLVIVQDKYAEGIVNVTDLLSAQDAKFTADRLAVVAVYEFLLDIIDLQRALSWFEDDHSAEEQAALGEYIRVAVETVGEE
jgi:outer membrane protein TolC